MLLGKYPGQIPIDLKREPDLQLARDRVLEIVLRGGATDLFCLQVGGRVGVRVSESGGRVVLMVCLAICRIRCLLFVSNPVNIDEA